MRDSAVKESWRREMPRVWCCRRSALAVCLMVLTAALSGCGSEPVSNAATGEGRSVESETVSSRLHGKLVLTGSSTVAPLMAEIGRRFEAEHPDVRVDVQSGGSSRGIADAASGVADLGMASRGLKPDEADQGLVSHQIAVDGICLIAHRSNPIAEVSKQQVVDLFTGQTDDWSQINGQAGQVVVVSKAEGRGTLEVFLKHFELTSSEIDADVVVGDNQHGIKTVAGNEQAIGYVSIGAALAEAQLGTPIRLLAIDGVQPTAENVATGVFDVTRPLLLISKGELDDLAAAFVEFAQSSQVHDLVKAQGFEIVAE